MADEATARPSPSRFTALDLEAAEHLIHLSESSGSSGAAPAPIAPRLAGAGGLAPPSAASASSSASPRSVNAPVQGAAAAAEDDDEQEVGGRRRTNKRYRPIAEIYADTEPRPIGPPRGRKDRRRTPAAKEPEAPRKKK